MPITAEAALKVTGQLYGRLVARRGKISELEDYYAGKHPLRFASTEWRADHERRYAGFSDNWCAVVGSAPGERTDIKGFRIGDDIDDPMDDAERQLHRDWNRNDMPAQSSQGWLTTNITGRSAVMVWGNRSGDPIVSWEHPSQVIVAHDAETRDAVYALKAWADDGVEYATLYTPDEVWKWQSESGAGEIASRMATAYGFTVPAAAAAVAGGPAWQPRDVPEDDSWPLPNPIGEVPVVEFANRPPLRGEPISDIDGTRSMQDAINMLWAYLLVAADFASLPQRVVMGQQPPKVPILDENGQVVGEQTIDIEDLRRGRFLWLTGQQTSIGEFKAASLDPFLSVINVLARHISAQTKTPIYLIHGELGNVNGETISAMDQPLNGKVRESHKFHTGPIRRVHRLMALVRGDAAVADACLDGVVKWANPEVRSDAQRSDAALKDKAVGLPMETILADRYDKSQAEISRILAQVDANSAREIASAVAPILRPPRQPGEPAPAEPAA